MPRPFPVDGSAPGVPVVAFWSLGTAALLVVVTAPGIELGGHFAPVVFGDVRIQVLCEVLVFVLIGLDASENVPHPCRWIGDNVHGAALVEKPILVPEPSAGGDLQH